MGSEATSESEPRSQVWLARFGLRLSDWFERWFPDAFALALLAVCIVFVASVGVSGSPLRVARWFGAGFWDLVAFTMQMALIVISGYAVATAPIVHAGIRRLGAVPTDPRGAVVFVGVFSMMSSLLSWSFSLVFSGLLAREVARRIEGADYRAVGAAAYLGVGSVWALGLSSSAALIMATPASLPASIAAISGVIPLTQTIGLWQSLFTAIVLIVVSAFLAFYSAPSGSAARGMKAMGVSSFTDSEPLPRVDASGAFTRPGEWLERSPLLSVAVGLCGLVFIASEIATQGPGVVLGLNHYIFLFLVAALLLHWRPRSFVAAVTAAVPAVGGVLVQYPLYAGIVRMMTESGLSRHMAEFFVSVSNVHTFPVLVGIYSAILGVFIPSAGGKWIIEAPYLLDAATTLQVHLGWVVQTYNATEALANLIHPFWMLPLLGILGLKPRDIIGFSVLQFVVHVPVVLFLVWILNYTLSVGVQP